MSEVEKQVEDDNPEAPPPPAPETPPDDTVYDGKKLPAGLAPEFVNQVKEERGESRLFEMSFGYWVLAAPLGYRAFQDLIEATRKEGRGETTFGELLIPRTILWRTEGDTQSMGMLEDGLQDLTFALNGFTVLAGPRPLDALLTNEEFLTALERDYPGANEKLNELAARKVMPQVIQYPYRPSFVIAPMGRAQADRLRARRAADPQGYTIEVVRAGLVLPQVEDPGRLPCGIVETLVESITSISGLLPRSVVRL